MSGHVVHTFVNTAACPQALEVYKLPEQMATKVQEQYERDVARVHGGGVVSMDAEYKSFLQELGGGPPPELMGLDPAGESINVCGVCVCQGEGILGAETARRQLHLRLRGMNCTSCVTRSSTLRACWRHWLV